MTNCQKDYCFLLFFVCLFLYTENVNTVFNITYKDNEHLAVKCVVRSLGARGVLHSEKTASSMHNATKRSGPALYTGLHHSTV